MRTSTGTPGHSRCGGEEDGKEKFAGAEATYTIIEPMMHNGVALQGGTSHYFEMALPRLSISPSRTRKISCAIPTRLPGCLPRMIGAVIMVHGDDNGLVLPPKIAPIQVVIVPVAQHKPGVLEKARELQAQLSETFRVKLDDSDNSPGWKFAQYEMQGVPLRLEIGPKDIENGQCVLVRRDNRESSSSLLKTWRGPLKARSLPCMTLCTSARWKI